MIGTAYTANNDVGVNPINQDADEEPSDDVAGVKLAGNDDDNDDDAGVDPNDDQDVDPTDDVTGAEPQMKLQVQIIRRYYVHVLLT